jgi:cytochrome c-type biogenesis protein CcmH/NrfG
MSLLDKEVAEERYEAAETSLALAKERVAELEVELEVVMAETGEYRTQSVPSSI